MFASQYLGTSRPEELDNLDRMLIGELNPSLSPAPNSAEEDFATSGQPAPFLERKREDLTPPAYTPFLSHGLSSRFPMQVTTRPQDIEIATRESLPSFGELIKNIVDMHRAEARK